MKLTLPFVVALTALGLVHGNEKPDGKEPAVGDHGAGFISKEPVENTKGAKAEKYGGPNSPPKPGCRGWVECIDGYWGNMRCTDGWYCRGGWEGDDNKAAVEESTKEERSGPNTPPKPGCRGWVECIDGYWGNMRCTDGWYCRGGWEGDDNKAAVEESTKEEKSGPNTPPKPGCRGWVQCIDGYWSNMRCTDGWYCRGGWEGDDNKAAVEESTKEEKSGPNTPPKPGCRGWVQCIDGYWGNMRCTDGWYCRGGWEGDDNKAAVEESTKEEKSGPNTPPKPGCRGWVQCIDGYWGNMRCTDGWYCRGGWEGDDNKAAVEESTKEEKSGPNTPPKPGCRGWVECIDGYWGNMRCTDGWYCRGGWEGDDNKAAVKESTKEEKSGPNTPPKPGCRGWVQCIDGYWGNMRCTDGWYCRGGWEGDDNKAAVEESTKEEKSGPNTPPKPGCRGWVQCIDGYWGNMRCTDGWYCRGGWEGDDNKAAVEESTKEEKSGPNTPPKPGCRGWVQCIDGYWGNMRCTDGWYCRGGWEGDDNKAAVEESTKEEKSGPNTPPKPGCRGWVQCIDGYWGNMRCTDGWYCRGGWEGDDNKALAILP